MTGNEIRKQLKSFLPTLRIDADQLAELLGDTPLQGYILWVAEKFGPSLLEKKLLSENNLTAYQKAVVQETAALPQHLVNAGNMYAQLTSSDLGMEDALKHLQEMTMPHVIYLLFAAEGLPLSKFEEKARNYCQMFPQVIETLPEPYKSIGGLLHDST